MTIPPLVSPHILSYDPVIKYDPAIEAEIEQLTAVIATLPAENGRFPARWLAIQLLEGDESLLTTVPEELVTAVSTSHTRLQTHYGADVDIAITDQRYRFVQALVAQVLTGPTDEHISPSDRLDRIVTHRWLGIPIFLALMYLVFNLVQTVSAPFLEWVDGVIGGPITRWLTLGLTWGQAPTWLTSLLVEGILAGVGGILIFLPGLLIMYLALAVLEDSGYLARAAFVMDRAMSKLGLHGRSFVPMILGFGCNVPAIFATRTIESRSARILTALLIPFMSCSARLPVYVIFGLAFFPQHGDWVIWGLYLLGILIAAIVGLALARTLFRHESPGILMMEMPAYRLPAPRRVLAYATEQSISFVRKAGTFILVGTVIFWLLLHLPWGVADARSSYFGQVSQAISPVLAPAGLGTWQATGALLTGFLAKEMVVTTLAQIYVGEENAPVATANGGAAPGGAAPGDSISPTLGDELGQILSGLGTAVLQAGKQLLETLTPGVTLFANPTPTQDTALTLALQQAFTPLTALAFLVFVLLYVPCIATVGAMWQEFGGGWTAVSVALTLVVPWILAVLVYQIGNLVYQGQLVGIG